MELAPPGPSLFPATTPCVLRQWKGNAGLGQRKLYAFSWVEPVEMVENCGLNRCSTGSRGGDNRRAGSPGVTRPEDLLVSHLDRHPSPSAQRNETREVGISSEGNW